VWPTGLLFANQQQIKYFVTAAGLKETAQNVWNVAALWLVVVLAGTALAAEARQKTPS